MYLQIPIRRRQQGVTLIELLVVMAVMLILLMIGLGRMAPQIESFRQRESARMVNSYIAQAQGEAARRGSPVGVSFVRYPGVFDETTSAFVGAKPKHCQLLQIVREPPPYGGDVEGAGVSISGTTATFTPAGTSSLASVYVKAGDRIQFDGSGPLFNVVSAGAGTSISFSGSPLPADTTFASYQVFRQPVPTSLPPLEVPEGTVIDLKYSGTGVGTEFNLGIDPVVVMFDSQGRVNSIYDSSGTAYGRRRVIQPIFFLLARASDSNSTVPNAPLVTSAQGVSEELVTKGGGSFWLSIHPDMGQVITSINVSSAGGMVVNRAEAIKRTSLGGR